MSQFRCRQWGSSEWTYISIEPEGEDEPGVASSVESILGSALSTSSLHVQRLSEEGNWEGLE